MSTTSSATTSAVWDQVPTDIANLHTHMCILILTKRDGTPFDVTSILEEDITKICIRQGHTHPMGVLCHLVTESIVLFQLADNKQHATCRAIKVTVLCEEAIAIRVSPPSTTHMMACMAMVGGEPSRTQPLPSDDEEELHSPTGNLTHLRECCNISRLTLGIWRMTNCTSLWRISAGRSHSVSWMHPQKPSTSTFGKPSRKQGSQSWWPGCHLSERGWVGSPRSTISTFYPCSTKWGMGSPGSTIPTCSPCTTRWGLGSPGTTSSTPTPAQPGVDMGHLINTLSSGLHLGATQINTFSCKAMPEKTEVSFKQWYHEVQYMKDHYPELVVWESIVRSLKGVAADMARYMGPTASVSNILQKLTVIFRMAVSFDILMQNFYKVTQGSHEKVPSFATRLEGTLNQIQLKCPGQIASHEVPWHLKDCLFHGVWKHEIPFSISTVTPWPPILS